VLITLCSLVSSLASAQVPTKLGYQGRLVKADGSSESGIHRLTFAIYDQAANGNSLWAEHVQVGLSEGYYSAVLGDVVAIGAKVFDGSERYLELAVDGQVLTPRQRIDTVPYALMCSSLQGGAVNASSISVGGTQVVDSSGKWVGSAAGLSGSQGPQGPQGLPGPQGPQGAFPGTIVSTLGNNGTVSCTTFCSGLGIWSMNGTCVGARLEIHANPSDIKAYNGKYVGCEVVASAISGWKPAVDTLQCWCISYE